MLASSSSGAAKCWTSSDLRLENIMPLEGLRGTDYKWEGGQSWKGPPCHLRSVSES